MLQYEQIKKWLNNFRMIVDKHDFARFKINTQISMISFILILQHLIPYSATPEPISL